MYEKYTDEELIVAYNDMMDYSGKISPDMEKIIAERGGIDNFKKLVSDKKKFNTEKARIKKEVNSLTTLETDIDFIKKLVSSEILTNEDLEIVITKTFHDCQSTLSNKRITTDTIVRSIVGLLIASVLGAVLWSCSILFLKKIYFPILIPIYVFNYFIIYLFTRKTRSNVVVFIASVLAIIGSIVMGWYATGLNHIFQ